MKDLDNDGYEYFGILELNNIMHKERKDKVNCIFQATQTSLEIKTRLMNPCDCPQHLGRYCRLHSSLYGGT